MLATGAGRSSFYRLTAAAQGEFRQRGGPLYHAAGRSGGGGSWWSELGSLSPATRVGLRQRLDGSGSLLSSSDDLPSGAATPPPSGGPDAADSVAIFRGQAGGPKPAEDAAARPHLRPGQIRTV